jgi:hypothetical protein
MSTDKAAAEIDEGFASIRTALGDPKGVSDFFRIPGLLRQDSVEQLLKSRHVMTWSLDFVADDWTHINDKEIARRAIQRIEARGKGILLLHDIHEKTAMALPIILHELKARGYHIVHVVEATPNLPKTPTLPEQWLAHPEKSTVWGPSVSLENRALPGPVLEVPNPRNFGVSQLTGTYAYAYSVSGPSADQLPIGDGEIPGEVRWPAADTSDILEPETTPIPARSTFRYVRVWQPHAKPLRATKTKPGTKKRMATNSIPSSSKGAVIRVSRNAPPKRPPARAPGGHQLQLQPQQSKPTTPDFWHRIGLR